MRSSAVALGPRNTRPLCFSEIPILLTQGAGRTARPSRSVTEMSSVVEMIGEGHSHTVFESSCRELALYRKECSSRPFELQGFAMVLPEPVHQIGLTVDIEGAIFRVLLFPVDANRRPRFVLREIAGLPPFERFFQLAHLSNLLCYSEDQLPESQ